ncbi:MULTISPECIES: flippase [Methanosphaera]|uniref:Predicted polysaccharide biosynthesis protein n=3 Tax=Methanosphaera TaxID=2316 RepID=Q2NIA5_METST|nr:MULTISPECIES: flippase [Methanosphaera]ABC56485.1 predicted polysaccharide biosynthesis protein [Methanosphaera stadtmanae DSM 3091]OEC90171.1 transporter [Methanosphaera sp. A6]RAP03767.1 transporter [Methanosphaera stadtmanae]RAP48805.1 MAG: transporter [Methanosphaera sp. DEW79]
MLKLKNIFKSKEYKRILENMISLTGLQFASYILPLITLPYLTLVLGPEKFGLTQYAISLITYFQFFTDYGFNLSATRELAICRDDNQKISQIFSSVMFIKLCLCILSFIILLLIVMFIPKFNEDSYVYILTFGMVIGYMLFPTWLFQGLEYMRYTSILNIIGKIVFTVLIFIFIHDTTDYMLVPLINSLGYILVGILGIYIALTKFNIKITIPSIRDIKYHLREGWYVFISTIAINMYTTTNTFLLGLLTNNTLVGYYSIAEKIILAVNGLLNPISQALYPFISRTVKTDDKTRSIEFIRKITKIMTLVGIVLSAGLFIFAKPIILLLFGQSYVNSVIILQIISIVPLAVSLSTVFGVETMLTFNYKKAFTSIVMIGGIIDIVLGIILITLMKEIGIAISFATTEIFITIAMFIFLQRKGIKIINRNHTKLS